MIDRKKISAVQFVDRFLPEVDGVVRVVENYARIMSRNVRSLIVAPRYSHYQDNSDYDVVRVTSLRSRITDLAIPVRAANRIPKRLLKKRHADIYHAHSPFIVGHFALHEARKNGVPIVATFHSKYKDDFLQITKSRFLTRFCMKYIMDFYNACDVVWACSKTTADTLRSYGYTKEITVMENGTDFSYPSNAQELKAKVMETYHIDENHKNILFVGQLIWQKNLRLVFDTMKILTATDPSYHLYVVGTSAFEKQIKDYVQEIGIEENVHFTGSIKDRDLLKGMYTACHLFFFPSLYDNSPLVLREASVMRIPSLLCLGSNASEVIRPDSNGFLEVPDAEKMASKIKDLFAHPDLMKEAGLNASRTIPVTWDEIIDRVLEEYASIIEKYKEKTDMKNPKSPA